VKRLFWSVIISCHCWAQTGAPKPEPQIGRGLLDDLGYDSFAHECNYGKQQLQVTCTVDPYTEVPREGPNERPTGQTISVRQLRHKIPKEAVREFHRAIKFSRTGEHEKAATELEAALHRDPEFSSAEDLLGIEYASLERREEAEMAFRRTIDLEPAWWMGHYNLARILYDKGDVDGAEESLRRALVCSSENPKIHLALGKLLVGREATRAEGIGELRIAAHTMADARRALRDLGAR
jgi:tetratricopeptide (TPR) repeat protein